MNKKAKYIDLVHMMNLFKTRLKISDCKLNRRRFLKMGAIVAMGGISPYSAFGNIHGLLSPERSLSFYNLHTGESLKRVYRAKGKYIPEALDDINYILRDHRTDEIKAISITLLDLLDAIQMKFESQQTFHIISGYRSAATNILLRKQSNGVAKNSLHMYGKAVDICLPGCKLHVLRKVAMDLNGGGVGYYPNPNFVHIDVGPVRYW